MNQENKENQGLWVSDKHEGQRIDNYLIRELTGAPKSLIYRLLRKKFIKVNRKRIKPEYRVQAGDHIWLPNSLRTTDKAPIENMAKYYANLAKSIVSDTADFVILNKPAGLACHGGSGVSASVIDIMRTQYPDLQLAHRLDKETSGCLALPKKRAALLQLNRAIQEKLVDKYYLCIVEGVWPKHKQKITLPLRKLELANGDRRVVVDSNDGKPATTLVRRIACDKEYSLLAIKLITGRTHQIRVHCAANGHPIVGDQKYGENKGADRLYLHAVQLGLSKDDLLFKADPDRTFSEFCAKRQFKATTDAAGYF